MINAHDYNITIRHGVFEGEACFEARVRELPDIVEYGDSFAEVYELAIDAIETTAEIMAEKGRPMPSPMDIPDDFSGRVTLRLPKTLHRSLAMAAEAEGMSLNGYMTYVLSYYSGVGAAGQIPAQSSVWMKGEPPGAATPQRKTTLQVIDCTLINQEVTWRETA